MNKNNETFATDEDEENTKADLLIPDPEDEVAMAKIWANAKIIGEIDMAEAKRKKLIELGLFSEETEGDSHARS